MKSLQCQGYANTSGLTSRVPLSLWHYRNEDHFWNNLDNNVKFIDEINHLKFIEIKNNAIDF